MATRRCLACGTAFSLRAQTPDQGYCSAKACQRDRRKHWQRDRRESVVGVNYPGRPTTTILAGARRGSFGCR
jgi:hypothetical protein